MKKVFRYEVKARSGLALGACLVVALFLIAASPATASATGTIVIISQSAPEGPDPIPYSATGQVNENFSLVDNGVPGTNTRTFNNVAAGSTTFTRGASYLYDLTNITCSVTGSGGSTTSANIPLALVNINLADGDTVTCSFFNSTTFPLVNSTADTGIGADCETAGGICTLRAAILYANEFSFFPLRIKFNIPTTDPGYDPVTQSYTISLLSALPAIDSNTSILGLGARRLTVRRSPSAVGFFSLFRIAAGRTVRIDGVTITGGNNDVGGGVHNSGTLTLTNSVVTGNQAVILGGGIFNQGSSTLIIENSTISANSAGLDGGGIFNGGTATLRNSTVSGNSATNVGGGVFSAVSTTITIENSTISDNQAGTANGGFSNSGTATLINTMIANSTNGDCATTGTINASFSLIESGLGCVNGTNLNNLTGYPMLGPLADNGGSTFTHALLAGSPAIDTGNSTLTRDQRGLTRPIDDPASPNGAGNLADIGAFEVQLIVADADGDGVLDDVDRCLGTVLPEVRPAGLKKNRFYADASGNFIDAENTFSGFTVVDTGGCSGRQIIDAAGLGSGHIKFGITRGALLDWIALSEL